MPRAPATQSITAAELENITTSAADPIVDSYFLDNQEAINCALQCNTLLEPCGKERLQLCYYGGDAVENAPLNLINVPVTAYSSFFTEQTLPLPQRLVCAKGQAPQQISDTEAAFSDMNADIQSLREERNANAVVAPFAWDSYFLDPRVAYHTAMQQNRVSLNHPTITGLQVCYYDGEELEGAPDNLINVKLEDALTYFSLCSTRLPQKVVVPANADSEMRAAIEKTFDDLLAQVKKNQLENLAEMGMYARQHSPTLSEGEKPRVLLPSSRRTTVMQYVSRNLAHALEKLGFETLFYIESELELMDGIHIIKKQLEFDPHILFYINLLNNFHLNEDVYNIVWYQDAMQEITQGKALNVRDRDVFVTLPSCKPLLENCNVHDILTSNHCVNTDLFKPREDIPRENKVVFAGTNMESYIRFSEKEQVIVDQARAMIYELIDSDKPITHSDFDKIIEQTQSTRLFVYHRVFYMCVRNRTLQWLCQNKDIEVEIYGSGWESEPDIAPFAKGLVEHAKLPEIYASAKYAFLPASDNLHLQRLGEVSAAGCIPLSFDIRQLSVPPLWEDEILYFRNPKELAQCLRSEPKNSPRAIAQAMSCDNLIQRIFTHMNQRFPDFTKLTKAATNALK